MLQIEHETIREAHQEDIPSLMNLMNEAFDGTGCQMYGPVFWSNRINDVLVAVASDNTVVGYLLYSYAEGEVEICSLAVTPTYQRGGIGKRLMERLESSYKLSTFTLNTHTEWYKTINFYLQLGFKITDMRFHGYGMGDHGYTLVR